jgi:uncharacterized protein involved in cysteine biosynthesis
MAHPTVHLVRATRDHLDDLQEPYRTTALTRARTLPVVLRIRLILILLLSPAVLATILSAIARVLPAFADIVAGLNWILSLAATLALLVLVLFFLVNRFLAQVEKDLIACLALGTKQTGLATKTANGTSKTAAAKKPAKGTSKTATAKKQAKKQSKRKA